MNKKAVSIAFEKIIVLIIALIVIIAVFVFIKGSLTSLISSFMGFIKEIFK